MKIHPYLSEFRECLITSGYSADTVSGYLIDVGMFISWVEAHLQKDYDYSIVSASTINDHVNYLVDLVNNGKYKISTIARKIQAIRCYLLWAKEKEHMDFQLVNPISGVNFDSSETIPLTKTEQRLLAEAIENDLRIAKIRFKKRFVSRVRDCSMVIFVLNTGLKMEELLSLLVSDIVSKGPRGFVSIKEDREVPLNELAQKAVDDWVNVRPQTSNEYLWIAVENEQEEGPLSSRSFQRVVKRIGQDAGIENLTPYKLRMTFGQNVADGGADPLTLARLLGVSRLNSVKSFYKNATENSLAQAVNGLAKTYKSDSARVGEDDIA